MEFESSSRAPLERGTGLTLLSRSLPLAVCEHRESWNRWSSQGAQGWGALCPSELASPSERAGSGEEVSFHSAASKAGCCAHTAGQAPVAVFTLLPGQAGMPRELKAGSCQRAEDQGHPQQPCQPCLGCVGTKPCLAGKFDISLGRSTCRTQDLHGLVETPLLSPRWTR